MSKLLNNIKVKHYRGFRDEIILNLSDINNVTYLVGPNNSGKSLISRLFSIFNIDFDLGRNIFVTSHIKDNDFFALDVSKAITILVNINTSFFTDTTDTTIFRLKKVDCIDLQLEIRKVRNQFICCVSLVIDNESTHYFDGNQFKYNPDCLVCRVLDVDEDKISALCKKLFDEIKNNILVFDSIRAFDRLESEFYKNGNELIEWLAENEHPSETTQVKKQVKEWIRDKFNLDEPLSVRADIENRLFLFQFGDIELSSKEIGTGYTMLYILLMEIVRNQKRLIIIDEIESHLQPGLIRILIRLIREYGDSQYIIATHSAPVIETANENDILYRFSKKGECCKFYNFFRDSQDGIKYFREVCNELGVVPGDALLSNVVIWVEGPSELFWVRAWLRKYIGIYFNKKNIKGNLIEGLHYTILMTGGSNISHLSFDEEEYAIELLDEDHLIKVLRVNPNPFVMVDSDNSNKESKKYRRLIRIASELNQINKLNNVFEKQVVEDVEENMKLVPNYWVLSGKELENYVHPQLLYNFYKKRSEHPKSKITGVDQCEIWDVYSSEEGVGKILSDRGITNIAKDSGTILHKDDLARYIFKNLKPEHFEAEPNGIMKPNKDMLNDLIENLDKMIDYIVTINNIS